MMPGFGWGRRGRGRGWFGGRWSGWWGWYGAGPAAPWWLSPIHAELAARGYRYIGPCRSGFGPFAFYLSPDGRVVPAWQALAEAGIGVPITTVPMAPSSAQSKEALEAEREALLARLRELEARLRALEGEDKD